MALRGPEYLKGGVKGELDAFMAQEVAGVLLIPALGVAAVSAVHPVTRSKNPLYCQLRGDVIVPKIRTLPRLAEEGRQIVELNELTGESETVELDEPAELQTFGSVDPRTSKLMNLIRISCLDETPQLVLPVRRKWLFVGPKRLLLPKDEERMREADPIMYDDLQTKIKENDIKNGLTTPGNIWLKRVGNPHNPAALRMAMRLNNRYIDRANPLGDLRIYATLPLNVMRAVVLPREDYVEPTSALLTTPSASSALATEVLTQSEG